MLGNQLLTKYSQTNKAFAKSVLKFITISSFHKYKNLLNKCFNYTTISIIIVLQLTNCFEF